MDIVEELKGRVEEVYGGRGTVLEYPDDLCIRAAAEIERLRGVIKDGVETLEAMSLHIGNPLYARLRATIEPL